MSDELSNIMGAISTESLIAELMRRHYLEPVKKTEDQVAQERCEFLLSTYTEDELHAKEMHPNYYYRTFTCNRKSDLGWEPEDQGWVRNKEYNEGFYRDDYTDNYHYRKEKRLWTKEDQVRWSD